MIPPERIRAPTRMKAIVKDLASPIRPINVGTIPAPIMKAMGIASDTARFLLWGETVDESIANPAGKKQTAKTG